MEIADLLGKTEASVRMDLSRAGIKISNFPAVMTYCMEELEKLDATKRRKLLERDLDKYSHEDVLSAMKRLSQRQCKPTHLEVSSEVLKEIMTTLPWAKSQGNEIDVEDVTRLIGLKVLLNDSALTPSVQWWPDNVRPMAWEAICQGE